MRFTCRAATRLFSTATVLFSATIWVCSAEVDAAPGDGGVDVAGCVRALLPRLSKTVGKHKPVGTSQLFAYIWLKNETWAAVRLPFRLLFPTSKHCKD